MTEEAFEAPIVEPKETVAVTASVGGDPFTIFSFKYSKTGDFLVFSSLQSKQVAHGEVEWVAGRPPESFEAEWLPPDSDRGHVTLHPSKLGVTDKSSPVVNGLGGIRRVGIDLRTIDRCLPLMTHRLAQPDAYPSVKPSQKTRLHLGEVYERGAPSVVMFATPIADKMVAATRPRAWDLVIEPTELPHRGLLLQALVDHDPSKPWWPHHVLSFPMFAKQTETSVDP